MALSAARTFDPRENPTLGSSLNKTFLRAREVFKMAYGHKRRAELMKLFETGFESTVNRRGCPILKYDTDLQYLIRKGKIELVNEQKPFYRFPYTAAFKHSFVRLKKSPMKKKVKPKYKARYK